MHNIQTNIVSFGDIAAHLMVKEYLLKILLAAVSPNIQQSLIGWIFETNV